MGFNLAFKGLKVKIYIKIAPTCFGKVTPSSESALFMLAEVTLVKIVNYGTPVCD
jgi:hypothetical protein